MTTLAPPAPPQFLACVVCGETNSVFPRSSTPIGILCSECRRKAEVSAREYGGWWRCRCQTLAHPCGAFVSRYFVRGKTKFRFNQDGTVKPYGERFERRDGPCGNTPCYHLAQCHGRKPA